MFREWDTDGGGTVGIAELLSAAAAYRKSQQEAARLRKMIVGLLLALVVLAACTFATSSGAVEMGKEAKVKDGSDRRRQRALADLARRRLTSPSDLSYPGLLQATDADDVQTGTYQTGNGDTVAVAQSLIHFDGWSAIEVLFGLTSDQVALVNRLKIPGKKEMVLCRAHRL